MGLDHVVVIKWGGSLVGDIGAGAAAGAVGTAAAPEAAVSALARGILDLIAAGYRALVVHGGGLEITRLSARLGLTARFEAGLRVTDETTLNAAIMALAGTVSTGLVAGLQLAGVPAVGLSGVDGGLLRAAPADPSGRLGLVGEITAVNTRVLTALAGAGLVPVVAPITLGPAGPLNVNADLAAAALAGALAAEHLVLLTDVPGVMVGGRLRRYVQAGEIEGLVASGEVTGGMIPKLGACRQALASGARRAHVLPGAAAADLAAVLRGEAPEEALGTTVGSSTGGLDWPSVDAATPAGRRPVLMDTYARWPVAFTRGEGSWLYTEEGEAYLDLTGGIAVTVLGHAHPGVTRAIAGQAGTLVHCSNLYEIPGQEALAARLAALTGLDRVFFCNSGAEANEAAIKLARRFAWIQGGRDRHLIITLAGSFHGRTLGALSATAQPKYQEGFGPLVPGFLAVPPNDAESLAQALEGHAGTVCAVLLEPVLGEGGVIPLGDSYLREVERLCRHHGVLLLVDEVQTGMGRTGTFLASQAAGVRPDVVTLAKGLANGVPIGAVLATEEVAAGFVPGSHGSTFGGNPLACAAALATLDVLEREDLPGRAVHLGRVLAAGLHRLVSDQNSPAVGVRGKGLMLGLEVSLPASDVVAACLEEKLLVTTAGARTVRFLPALTITEEEIDEGLARLVRALRRLGPSPAAAGGSVGVTASPAGEAGVVA